MSRCISSHGEYSEHTFPPPRSALGRDRFTCTLCGVFDEWEALAALTGGWTQDSQGARDRLIAAVDAERADREPDCTRTEGDRNA